MRTSRLLFAILAVAAFSVGQQTPPGNPWSDWNFLLGEWDLGQGGGVPGQASAGYFSLKPDLGGKILLRRNHSEYSAGEGKSPVIHDDLMIIFREAGTTKAFYSDSEGHIIQYNITLSPDGKQITFLSEKIAGTPQYRLIYENIAPGAVSIVFEVASPDKPGQFSRYVEGVVHRKMG